MEIEDLPDESADQTVDSQASARRPAGFLGGIILGVLLGAGLALLLAPDRGDKTRGRLRRRIHSLREDAREGIDRAGSLTRDELRRGKRRFQAELARARERAERALD